MLVRRQLVYWPLSLPWDCFNCILVLWTCLSFLPSSNGDGKGEIILSLAELSTVMTPLSFELPASPSICFIENDFSVSILSVSGGITLRNNSDPIIFVSYMSISYWKWHLRSDSNPISSAHLPVLEVLRWSLWNTLGILGLNWYMRREDFLLFILANLLWKQQYLVLISTLRHDSFLNLLLFTRSTGYNFISQFTLSQTRLLDLKCYCVVSETVIFIKSYLSIRSRAEQDAKRSLWCLEVKKGADWRYCVIENWKN